MPAREMCRSRRLSIYRRWGDARTMVNDLATYRLDPDRGLPDTGDLRADLTTWAQELISHYSVPVNAALLRGGAAAAGEDESDCLRDRRTEAAGFATRPGSTFTGDQVIDLLVAPIIYRAIFLPWTRPETAGQTRRPRLTRGAPGVVACPHPRWISVLLGEVVAVHRQAAQGLLPGGFLLDHVRIEDGILVEHGERQVPETGRPSGSRNGPRRPRSP
ncbi:hypothetical protein [Streptomyces mirabilis]|uniref:hypothetical protein n=1 Tax=Streptomyces mirabilis TaxID=68239 RepID=UPI0036E8A1C1